MAEGLTLRSCSHPKSLNADESRAKDGICRYLDFGNSLDQNRRPFSSRSSGSILISSSILVSAHTNIEHLTSSILSFIYLFINIHKL
jgi:hypothetical protein